LETFLRLEKVRLMYFLSGERERLADGEAAKTDVAGITTKKKRRKIDVIRARRANGLIVIW
jgi:hypothetical protein